MSLVAAISTFGTSPKGKFDNPAISGQPEDQLRAPLDTLIRDLARCCGLPEGAVHLKHRTLIRSRSATLNALSSLCFSWVEQVRKSGLCSSR